MRNLRVLWLAAFLGAAVSTDSVIRDRSQAVLSMHESPSQDTETTTSSPEEDTTQVSGVEESTKQTEELPPLSDLYASYLEQCDALPVEQTTTESPGDDTTTTAAPQNGDISDEEAAKEEPKENEGQTEKWVKVQEPKNDGKGSICKNGGWTNKFATGSKANWHIEDCAKLLNSKQCSDTWFSVSKEDGRCYCVNAGDKCKNRRRKDIVFGLYQKIQTNNDARFKALPDQAGEERPAGVPELSPADVQKQLKADTLAYLQKHPELKADFHLDEFLGQGEARFAEVEVDVDAHIAVDAAAAVAQNMQEWMDHEAALAGMTTLDMQDAEDDIPGADLTQRVYKPPRISNNSDVNDLVDAIVAGVGDNPEYGVGDSHIKNLKNMSSAYAESVAKELEQVFQMIDVQTEGVYNSWLSDTCKKVRGVDNMAAKRKALVAHLKEINKKCNETVGNLRKQKVTKDPPTPVKVGANKVKFEYVNPADHRRQYSRGHSGNGQLDNGQGARMTGYGHSTILDLGSQQRVRGVVVQGLPQNGDYLKTFHVQYSSDGSHWTTVSDPGSCSDTSGWNNKVPRVCHDTPGWYPTNWGWWGNRRYRRYYYGHWCINGRIRYRGWRHVLRNHNDPVNNVCHCGKKADPDKCSEYVSNNWCKDGAVTWRRGESVMGPSYNWPENNCAACGKCATDFVGGRYNDKAESLFPKPVDARYVRIIMVEGAAAFRVAAITGRSVVDTTLTKPSYVAMVGFDYPNHPLTIQVSDDGQNWKTVATNVIKAKHTFSPPVHTSHVRIDWEEAGCNTFGGKPLTRTLVEAMGFKLVRHTDGHLHGSTRPSVHPARDQLRGTEAYGSKSDDYESADGDWSVRFNNEDFDEFLFASGDLTHWLIAAKDQVWGWYNNKKRTIKCSSTNAHSYQARWYRRRNAKEDPWISLGDHQTRSPILYGGNSYGGWPARGPAKQNHGLNVFIRKGKAGASSKKEIDVSVIGYDKDPGNLLYPDSPVRVEACSEASKKEKAKQQTESEIEQLNIDIAADAGEVAKNVEFLQFLNGARSRSAAMKSVYGDAEQDAEAWEEILEQDATPIQPRQRSQIDPRDLQPADE